MKKIYVFLILFVALCVGFGIGWFCKTDNKLETTKVIHKTDTLIQIDSIRYVDPVPIESIVIKRQIVKVPVSEPIYIDSCSETVLIDSVFVEIPITQKEYKDSTYHAWVSGYNAKLDSINVFQKTINIKEQIIERITEKPKRWGFGVQVGAGYDFNLSKPAPYIGIGISYNILTW